MRGTLYLRSVRNFSNVPEGTVVINIARKDINGLEKFIELAPSKDLFYWYLNNKESNDWFKEYKIRYTEEIKRGTKSIAMLNYIESKLNEGISICLVCFCEDVNKCHRGIVGKWYELKGLMLKTRLLKGGF